jgi:hypothetical protein
MSVIRKIRLEALSATHLTKPLGTLWADMPASRSLSRARGRSLRTTGSSVSAGVTAAACPADRCRHPVQSTTPDRRGHPSASPCDVRPTSGLAMPCNGAPSRGVAAGPIGTASTRTSGPSRGHRHPARVLTDHRQAVRQPGVERPVARSVVAIAAMDAPTPVQRAGRRWGVAGRGYADWRRTLPPPAAPDAVADAVERSCPIGAG